MLFFEGVPFSINVNKRKTVFMYKCTSAFVDFFVTWRAKYYVIIFIIILSLYFYYSAYFFIRHLCQSSYIFIYIVSIIITHLFNMFKFDIWIHFTMYGNLIFNK